MIYAQIMTFMSNEFMTNVVVFQNISILKKMRMFCLGIFDFCLGMKWVETLLEKEKNDNFDSSDALSDQVLSLDIVEDVRDRQMRR